MSHVVTGALAVVADATGVKRYYYQGTVLPEDLPSTELQRLTEIGLVAREVAPAVHVDAAPPKGDPPKGESSKPEPARPADVASKGTWVEYAVSRGTDRRTAEAMTRPQLIDAYPPS